MHDELNDKGERREERDERRRASGEHGARQPSTTVEENRGQRRKMPVS